MFESVFELECFKNVQKVADFPYVRGEGEGRGVNQHMENSICFCRFFLKASLRLTIILKCLTKGKRPCLNDAMI